MVRRRKDDPEKYLECGICHRSEPEIKIARLPSGAPRAHRMCETCRNAVRRSETRMRREISNRPFEALWRINWDSLLARPKGNYGLSFSLQDEAGVYPGGVICLREDFAWIYTYEGTYQWPAPYDHMRIAKHLAYLHLYISSKQFPQLSDEERAELENTKDLSALRVFGVC